MKGNVTSSSMSRRRFLQGTLSGSALLAVHSMGLPSIAKAASTGPPFDFPPLPYAQDALSPYISARTISFHYGKHHQGYVNKINRSVQDTEFLNSTLEEIIRKTAGNATKSSIFNNAAQAWNHSFYWKSMKPNGGGSPSGRLASMIDSAFGSFDQFKTAFLNAAASQFGSGWAWLVMAAGELKVVKTGNADTPLAHGQLPLITIDVWEHAYYLDYQNRRTDYIVAYLEHLVNWEFATENMAGS